jgi:hypothetical protein
MVAAPSLRLGTFLALQKLYFPVSIIMSFTFEVAFGLNEV